MKCPVCGTIWKEGYVHCAYCGAELSSTEQKDGSVSKAVAVRRCELCGRSLPAYYRFCDYCGSAAIDQENDCFSQEAVAADVRPEIPHPVVNESVDLSVQENNITEEQDRKAENIFENDDNQDVETTEENVPEEQPEEPVVPTITFVQDDAEEYDEYDESDDYDESEDYNEYEDDDEYEEYYDEPDDYDDSEDNEPYDIDKEDDEPQDGDFTRIFDSHAVNAAAAQVNAKVHLCDYDEFARQNNRSIGIHNPRTSSGDGEHVTGGNGFGNVRFVLAWLLGLLAVAASVAAPVYSQNGGLIPQEYSCVLTDSMTLFRQMQLPEVWWVVFTAATLVPALLLVVFASARRRTACMISSELGLLLPLAAWVVKTAVSQDKIHSIGNSSLQIGFFAILLIHIIVITILAAGRRSSGRRD